MDVSSFAALRFVLNRFIVCIFEVILVGGVASLVLQVQLTLRQVVPVLLSMNGVRRSSGLKRLGDFVPVKYHSRGDAL